MFNRLHSIECFQTTTNLCGCSLEYTLGCKGMAELNEESKRKRKDRKEGGGRGGKRMGRTPSGDAGDSDYCNACV